MSEKNSLLWAWIVVAFATGLVLGGGGVYLAKGGVSKKDCISLYPPKAKEVGGDWLVKIDDYAIPKSEFEAGFKLLFSQIPESQRLNLPNEKTLKAQYLDSLQSEYVLTIKALKEGIQNSDEAKALINSSLRGAIYRLYLKKNSPQDESVFKPSKVEIEEYYAKNKAQFEKLGWKADQIRRYAEQDLAQRKMQEWIARFVMAKKEEFKIEKNKQLLEKIGVGDSLGIENIQPLPQK
jgi:hypothetical protein